MPTLEKILTRDPERYRSAAELCREKARSFSNSSEWVRFSQEWERLAGGAVRSSRCGGAVVFTHV
jgi:hypothetical protein